MFLNYLKEESKENFLKLCLAAAQANNVIEKEEEQLMYAYCKELGIKEQIPSGDIDVESVLSELKEKTNIIEKRVISLEILGLMYSDGEYDSSEKEFVDELVNKFEITKDELEKIDKLLNEYSEVYKKMVSEIILDLNFIKNPKTGITSLRLGHFIRDYENANNKEEER